MVCLWLECLIIALRMGCLCLMFGLCYLKLGCVLGRCIDLLVAPAVLALGCCALVVWCTILAIYLSSAVGFGVSSLRFGCFVVAL